MKIRLFCILALLILAASGCSKEESEPAVQERPAPVVRVEAPATAQTGQAVTVEVHFQVNGGCGHFGSFEVNTNGKEQVIQVIAAYQGEICTDDLPIRKAIYTFRPAEAGSYTLKFRSYPQKEDIMASIEVKTP